MSTVAELQDLPKWRRLVVLLAGFFGLFAGVGSLFALVLAAAVGWQEHSQAQWPEVKAQVQRCGLDIYTYRSQAYWIDCRISYTVRGQEIVSRVHSRTIPKPSRLILQYPPGQFDRMQAWVDEHPEGTPIKVHYDPTNPGRVALVETDMPRGGPQTPGILKLLGFFAVSCVVLLTIARIARPRPAAVEA